MHKVTQPEARTLVLYLPLSHDCSRAVRKQLCTRQRCFPKPIRTLFLYFLPQSTAFTQSPTLYKTAPQRAQIQPHIELRWANSDSTNGLPPCFSHSNILSTNSQRTDHAVHPNQPKRKQTTVPGQRGTCIAAIERNASPHQVLLCLRIFACCCCCRCLPASGCCPHLAARRSFFVFPRLCTFIHADPLHSNACK